MNRRLKEIVVIIACHRLIPLALATVGFLVLVLLTRHLLLAIPWAVIAAVYASRTANRYTLIAIGPRFVDRDFPITWSFIGNRVLRLLLGLLITPIIVTAIYFIALPFTSYCVIIALLSGLPAQKLVNFYLDQDAESWTWRIRRGTPIQSPEEVHRKVVAHRRKTRCTTDQCVPCAGEMVPRDLMAPHTKVFGMTGTGKTVYIRLHLQWLVSRCSSASNLKVVVFDPKRELYSYILGMEPQVPVLLFDATDRRGVAWDMAADITEPNHAKAAAKLLVPDESTSQPYFPRSARRILEWVIRYLIARANHWNLEDVFRILDDLTILRRVLPRRIVRKYFTPESTLKNTLSTLDTLTSRFETVAACWAKAQKEGRSLSLKQFEAAQTGAILVIPRRLDIAEAVDPTIRLIFERLTHLWLARPDLRFLPPECRPETHVILDETAKAGNLAHLDDLLLMGRAKGISVTLAAQDVEAMRTEYGEKVADSLMAQCGNTAVFALESPDTQDYCARLFGTYEIRERPRTFQATNMTAALMMEPKDLYHPGDLREHKTLLPSQFSALPRPASTGLLSGFFITGCLGAHWATYPFADLLLPPANVPVLLPRDAADQEYPDQLTGADLARLGIPSGTSRWPSPAPTATTQSPLPNTAADSLRFIKRLLGH